MTPRRVVLVSGPAYRPAAYRPPPLRLSESRLGQGEVKFNWGNLGHTILFGSMGVGAIYGSGLLPDPVKTIAMVGGIGLIGYAAYSLLGGSSKGENEVPTGTSSAISTPAEFNAVTGQFLYPKSGSRVGFSGILGSSYPVKVLLSNPNPKSVAVTVQLVVHEAPYVFIFIPARSEDYVAEVKTVVIPANGNIAVEFEPSSMTSRWVANLEMQLTLQKIRLGGEKADLDQIKFKLGG